MLSTELDVGLFLRRCGDCIMNDKVYVVRIRTNIAWFVCVAKENKQILVGKRTATDMVAA